MAAWTTRAAARGRADQQRGIDAVQAGKLIFALELNRRARAAGSLLISVAAHPGLAANGFLHAVGMPKPVAMLGNAAIGVLGQDERDGALAGLYAATMPDVRGGTYWGPDGWKEMRGSPRPAAISAQALDTDVAGRLWAVSEELTGVRFAFG